MQFTVFVRRESCSTVKWANGASSSRQSAWEVISLSATSSTTRPRAIPFALLTTAGVNFFDTADAYNKGEAEKVLGKHLAEFPRESLFVLTKCWLNITGHVNGGGLSAKHIYEACHASLKRLNMDYIDSLHSATPVRDTRGHSSLEETVRAMEDLARQGKILYWGVSEWPAHTG